MKLKVSLQKQLKHTELASCVGWASSEELFSSADDHKVLKWVNGEASVFVTFGEDVYPTSMHWLPRVGGAGSKRQMGSDLFVLTSTDGKFHLITKNGRIEKSVEAHRGATLAARWSHDGTALVTAGEDGQVKIWSRSGMLRSTLVQDNAPVYSIAWSPDADQVLYTLGKQLVIKPLQPNTKQSQWKAHDGVVLTVDWNTVTGLIISGSEECRYKIWDVFGRQIFSSQPQDYPITSLSWAPNGELFAVGSFNTLRLCDKTGWSYALEKPSTGSIFCLAWSVDSTQVAGACGNGQILCAHLVDKRTEWKNFEATVVDSKQIIVRNVINDNKDKLDFRDRVIMVSMAFNHLVVATSSQCHVYNTRNFNTPMMFDLKEGAVTCIIQAEKLFAVVDNVGIYIYSYEGRLLATPKMQSLRTDAFNSLTMTLSNDTLAVRERNDEKSVLLFEAQTGKLIGDGKPFVHKEEIIQIALDMCGPANERRLVFIDKNHDLFITSVRIFGTARPLHKIGNMIQSVLWNDDANILVAMGEGNFQFYYYPNAAFSDRNLLPKTIVTKDSSDLGRNLQLVSFFGNLVTFRRHEGSLVNATMSPYPSMLHGYVLASRWEDAVQVCRFVKDERVWSCLAAMAAYSKNFETAEVAYAALNQADKVQFLNSIRDISNKETRNSQLALFCGNSQEAEAILLQASAVFQAIMLNLQLYKWERALELAIKHKTHVDTVLAYRQRYLEKVDRHETNKRFLQYNEQVSIDWDTIDKKVNQEYEKLGILTR